MKHQYLKTSLVLPIIALAFLAACSPEPSSSETEMATMEPTSSEMQTMEHSGAPDDHMMPELPENTGYGVGEVRSIGELGDSLTIAHGPLQGIPMGAMTMGFDIVGDVDLSAFSDGDKVAFLVRKGRDNSYRISEICLTETDEPDCLSIFPDQ